MKKTFFYLLIFSQVFGQSIIDTLSVTVYPEFSYPGVAIEYKFDKSNNNDITFPIPANIDSVLYTISTCLLYTSPSPRDVEESRMPSSA